MPLSGLHKYRLELGLTALIAVLGIAVHSLNVDLEARSASERATGDVGPLPDGKALRVASLGFDRLVADLFWLRTCYYIGDNDSALAGYPAAERLANLVTDIDPSFRTPYVLMSGALSGLVGDPEAAIRLLEKGIRHVEYWKLHFLLGFNYFLEKQEFVKAGEQMLLAAEMDGGPFYLHLLASKLYARGGDAETALEMVQARLANEPHPEVRKRLEKRFWDIWITRDVGSINAAIRTYRAETQKPPESIAVLVAAGLLEREPTDPRGGTYSIRAGHAHTELDYEPIKIHMTYRPPRQEIERTAAEMHRQSEEATE